MYNITRQEASEILWVSTRSVDRYIRAWKLRSQKDWKIIYINNEDLNNLNKWWQKKQEVIVPNKIKEDNIQKTKTNELSEINFIYNDLKDSIKEKDKKIEELSIRLWKAEEIAKNSISMIEFKKSQFLLEQKEVSLEKDLEISKEENEKQEKELKQEKNLNIILFLISLILLIIISIIWFVKI